MSEKSNLSPEAEALRKTKEFINPKIEAAQNVFEPGVAAIRDFSEKKGITPKHLLIWTGVVVVLIVLAQNFDEGQIDFLFWSLRLPNIVIYLLMMILGGVLGIWLKGKVKEAFGK